MKKNIFDKFQDWLVLQIEKFEKREDRDVLRRVPFWILFFFPYGIYLLLFKTKVNKLIKVLVTIAIAFFSIIGLDIALYPNRVYDNTCKESYNKFVLEHEDLKLREPLYASKTSDFKLGDKVYFAFNIYDSLDMYYGIFEINNYHKDYKLVSLYDVDYDFSNVYTSKEFEGVKEIHPVVLSFILSSQKDFDLSAMSKETDVKEDDVFCNTINQELKVKNKIYSFEFNDFTVTKVVEKATDKVLFETSFEESFNNYMPQIVRNMLEKDFNSSYKIVGYNYFNNGHYYHIKVADKNYTVKYLPGVNAELLLVEDLDEFKSYLDSMINKY